MKKEMLINQLLEWYYEYKRDLPWRMESDPYRIWVSEIMLQQTRVDTVIPYYERFMKRFPTLEDLATAEEEEILKYWEGLGYYSRARNLHDAVKEVNEKYGGIVPDDEETISKLKGVGPYTKGAILSIAYQKPVPAVDGNVMRVISRIYGIEKDIAKQSTRREIETLVRGIIPHTDPSGFNQALMELGALICVPRTPLCDGCPVSNTCDGKRLGKAEVLPIKSSKEKKRDVYLITVVLVHQGKVLVRRRNENLLKGLWEFPGWETETEVKKINSNDFAKNCFKHFGVVGERFHDLGRVEHIFSHLRWKMQVFMVEVESILSPLADPFQWVTPGELDQFPFPVPHQKVREKWEKFKSHPSL